MTMWKIKELRVCARGCEVSWRRGPLLRAHTWHIPPIARLAWVFVRHQSLTHTHQLWSAPLWHGDPSRSLEMPKSGKVVPACKIPVCFLEQLCRRLMDMQARSPWSPHIRFRLTAVCTSIQPGPVATCNPGWILLFRLCEHFMPKFTKRTKRNLRKIAEPISTFTISQEDDIP